MATRLNSLSDVSRQNLQIGLAMSLHTTLEVLKTLLENGLEMDPYLL